jgi:hypothetical protein
MNPHADPKELQCTKNAENQRIRCADCGRIEEENNQQCTRCKTPGVVERESAQQAMAREVPGVVEPESAQQATAREVPGVVEKANNQQYTRRKTPGVVERKSVQQAAAREVPGVVECKSAQQAAAREVPGVVEHKSAHQAAAREVPGVVECKSAQQAVARKEPAVQEHKSRQCAAARFNKTFKMACKYINGQYIFHQPCGLWNAPCVHSCGYIHLLSSTPGSRKKCCTNGHLSSASDNFDKELMMDHDLDKLLQFLRQVITLSLEFVKKSSTHNNVVAMAATVVCNYNQTHGFSWRGQGPQSIFMNGCVNHNTRIASSTLQNCSISYFIFDDIASFSGSADTQNIDPVILSNICKGLRNENPY